MAVPSRAGYTLIEVTVVLLLIGVVGAVGVPAFSRLASEDPAVEAARRLELLLGQARRAAVERGTVVRLSLDPRTGSYSMELHGPVHALAPVCIAAEALGLPAGVRLEPDRAVVLTFHHLGAAAGDTLRVTSSGIEIRLAVDPWTGRTRELR